MVKNPSDNAGDIRDVGLIPGSERLLEDNIATHSSGFLSGEFHAQGAWWARVHTVLKSCIQLKQSGTTHIYTSSLNGVKYNIHISIALLCCLSQLELPKIFLY